MTVTDTPTRPELERWLDERDITWQYIDQLAIAEIDVAASLANQARLEPLSEDVVARYGEAMLAGDRFPPVVVRRHPDGQLTLIGGNHRAAAATRAEMPAVAAYIVDVDDAQALELAWEDNRRHGHPPTSAERDVMILRLASRGRTGVAIAQVVGASQPHVARVINAHRGDRRAEEADVDGWRRLAAGVRARIAELEPDPVFVAAAQLAADTHMRTNEVDDFVARIQRAGDAWDALELIGTETEARARHGVDRRGRGHPKRVEQAFHAISRALLDIKGLDPAQAAAGAVTADQRSVLQQRILDAAAVMSKTHQLLERASG